MGNSIFKKPFILALSAVFCAAAAKVATEEPNTQLDAFGFPVAWGPSPFVPCEVFFLKPAGCVGNGDLSEADALQQQIENSSDHRSAEAQMALDEYAREEFKNVLNPNSLPHENMFHLFLMMTSVEGFENAGKLGMTSGQLEKVASSVIGRYLDSIQGALVAEHPDYDGLRDLSSLAFELSDVHLKGLINIGLNDRGLSAQDILSKYEREALAFINTDPSSGSIRQEWINESGYGSAVELLLDNANRLAEYQGNFLGQVNPDVAARQAELETMSGSSKPPLQPTKVEAPKP